mgnify:CR=1 FL=1
MAEDKVKRSISFEWNGTEYTLEYNRAAAELLEKKHGINVMRMVSGGEVRVTDLPDMFRAALMMHHPNMKRETADALYSLLADKDGLYVALAEMLAATVGDIFEEPEEGKAICWTRF